MAVRRRMIVRGHVHGVGFRVSVARAAQSRGVDGWARNRADGSVEVVLEGEAEPVESLVRFCGDGPRSAWVVEVETFVEEPEGLRGFEIR